MIFNKKKKIVGKLKLNDIKNIYLNAKLKKKKKKFFINLVVNKNKNNKEKIKE
jgi:hypothetical protein